MDVIFVVFKQETVQINAVNSVSLPSKTITESVFNDISSKVKISLTSGRVSNMIVYFIQSCFCDINRLHRSI